ncbi:hypothetical protein BGZ61DRAFT_470660 [Ilyonectria robusta]|uniref:uncharacterized protein n=1 Tax=Ilyonectria robusta TaxID=1079257 RepID=UPI001E8DA59E|nr:uncharacterized protein BGZ61DRAFT_470660 [Ilyonectria robusta]KAH8737184.1 hypothetical protein BGZ61DRAFT_470660 [Ilyonectria robusta]
MCALCHIALRTGAFCTCPWAPVISTEPAAPPSTSGPLGCPSITAVSLPVCHHVPSTQPSICIASPSPSPSPSFTLFLCLSLSTRHTPTLSTSSPPPSFYSRTLLQRKEPTLSSLARAVRLLSVLSSPHLGPGACNPTQRPTALRHPPSPIKRPPESTSPALLSPYFILVRASSSSSISALSSIFQEACLA